MTHGKYDLIYFRFITSYDKANGEATYLEQFLTSVSDLDPDLVVLSGLHLLEGQPESLWQDKFSTLIKGLQQLPSSTPVHLELASMAQPPFIQQVVNEVRHFCHSFIVTSCHTQCFSMHF